MCRSGRVSLPNLRNPQVVLKPSHGVARQLDGTTFGVLRQLDGTAVASGRWDHLWGPPGLVPWTVNSSPLCLSARKAVHVAFREVPVFEVREVLRSMGRPFLRRALAVHPPGPQPHERPQWTASSHM